MNQLEIIGKAKPKSNELDFSEMENLMKYCEVIAKAPAYQAMGGMPGVFALVMTARELGIGPMMALNGGMYLIPPGIDKEGKQKGQPTVMMAAKTMSMMIWKCGHKIEQIEASDEKVILKGTRTDNGVSMTVTMTMKKAQQAGLSHDNYGKPKLWSPWHKNSEDMLWKTCIAKLGRRLFTDVIGNAYEPAEFEEKEAKDGKEIDVKPEKKALKGKNIAEISDIEKKESLQIPAPAQTFEDFVISLRLNPLDQNANLHMVEWIQSNATARNKQYDEMLNYCFDNREAFLNAYGVHCAKINESKGEKKD